MKRSTTGLTLTALLIGPLLTGPAAAQGTPRTDPVKGNPNLTGEVTFMTNKGDVYKAYLPVFQKLYPKVKVTLLAVGAADLRTKVTTAASANQVPADVMQVEAPNMEFLVRRFPTLLADLTPWAKKYQGGFPAAYWREGSVNGKVYGLPLDNSVVALYYRTDMFKKAGVNPATIKTWDDYIVAGKKVQAANPGVKMLSVNAFGDEELTRFLVQQATGGYYFNANGDIALNSPGAQRAMTTLKRMWDEKLILNVQNVDTVVGGLKSNKIATFPLPAFWGQLLTVIAPEQKGLWGTVPLPGFGKRQSADFGTSYLTVAQGSRNKEAAWALAEWAATVGGQRRDAAVNTINAYLPGVGSLKLKNPYFATPNYLSPFVLGAGSLPYLRFTSDAQAARDAVTAAQGAILNGAPIPATLDKAARDLANQTGRSIAK